MTTCPTCRAEAPDGARFCPSCGSALAVDPATATERKVVTTLFADLVDFTALGEQADPEDVDAALRSYYGMARDTIERFGGVVEKFIGDAVVGLFGVPLAHEDDAERAVRAALDIVAHMDDLAPVAGERLRVRASANTGPAFVRLRVSPASGEGLLVGDAVNTAARLLTAAPPMSVVVGETTHGLTERAIMYEERPAFAAKGKARPVKIWLARGAIARRGADFDRLTTTMVGREVELAVLKGLFEKALASSSPQFVLLMGEAGIGKSRVIHEFGQDIDRRPGLMCTWRQGQCPPYGEGLAFWALSEIVRSHAGILQGDEAGVVEEKLTRCLPNGQDEWLRTRLRPLVGLRAPESDREESFSAWLQFFEGVARLRPTVLVFEDLHWASEPTLAFLGHMIRNLEGVPLMIVATARPEFATGHPDVEGYSDRLTRLDLKSLAPGESSRLVSSLTLPGFDVDLRRAIVDRCGGNPLFAEELVRYLAEHPEHGDDLANPDASPPGAAPETIVSLIAARLDALPPEHKAVLADAAVVGQAFWPRALAVLGDRGEASVDAALDALAEREFVSRQTSSTLAGSDEFAFWHSLTRDVAYEQLPRQSRATKHARLARWIEDLVGAGSGELLPIRAHHYWTARGLALSTGDDDLAEELRLPALATLKRAGDGALSVDAETARQQYSRALTMVRPEDPAGPHLTVALAEAQLRLGQLDDAVSGLSEGISAFRANGERRAAAVAMTRLSNALYWRAVGPERETAANLRKEALDLLQEDGPSRELVTVLEERAVQCARDLECVEAVEHAEHAIAMCRDLGLPEPIRALAYRGTSLCDSGIKAGLDDLRRARQLALDRGSGLEADTACQILADVTYPYEGPEAGLELARQGFEYSSRRGQHLTTAWFQVQMLQFEWLRGHWSDALEAALILEGALEQGEAEVALQELRWDLAQIRLQQGDVDEAVRLLGWCREQSPSHPYIILGDLGARAACCRRRGDADGARTALAELEKLSRGRRGSTPIALMLPQVARAAVFAHETGLVRSIIDDIPSHRALDACVSMTLDGLVAECEERPADAARLLADAAAAWARFGDPWEEAQANRDRGRCLLALGKAREAAAVLREARVTFGELGAQPDLAETEALLDEVV